MYYLRRYWRCQGSTYENAVKIKNPTTYYLGDIKEKKEIWNIADDAQLTLAFCESLNDNNNFSPEVLSKYFVKYYREKKLSGFGAGTLIKGIRLDKRK